MGLANTNQPKIGIITYDHNHLKSEQVIVPLYNKGFDIVIYALPFVQRPTREVLFSHRPNQQNAQHPNDIANRLGIDYIRCASDAQIDNCCDLYIVTGAGILSNECVGNKKIINCHPGLIPASRGLDSFKWAIFDFVPIGNTLHFIDHRVDAGEIIYQEKTPLYMSDSIEEFALRHYSCEIEMLSNFYEHLLNKSKIQFDLEEGVAHKRMPLDVETEMLCRFEAYKGKFAQR